MIDVRSIPFGTRGAIDGPIRAEEGRGQKRRERRNVVDPRGVSRGEKKTVDEERKREGDGTSERLEHPGRGIPRDVLMVLEIENAPGQPKWVWLPSLVPIVSVGWNFGTKWRARDVTIKVYS